MATQKLIDVLIGTGVTVGATSAILLNYLMPNADAPSTMIVREEYIGVSDSGADFVGVVTSTMYTNDGLTAGGLAAFYAHTEYQGLVSANAGSLVAADNESIDFRAVGEAGHTITWTVLIHLIYQYEI